MTRIGIYVRVSTDRQSTGAEAQELALNQYCRANGLTDYKTFKDEGVSGSKISRPGLNQLMNEVRSREISMVVVYSFSRFARSTTHLLQALDEFSHFGVGFVSLTEKIDTASPAGRAIFTILGAISQLERELISERVKNGLRNARAKGHRIGRPKTRPGELIQTLLKQGHTYREISHLAKVSHGSIAAEARNLKRVA